MKIHDINVPTCALDPLLLEPPACPNGHRGIWFYSTELGIDIRVGDVVRFLKDCSDVVAAGVVTRLVNPADYEKYCSRVNNKGFIWRECVMVENRVLYFVRSDDGPVMLATEPDATARAHDVVYDNLESVPRSVWDEIADNYSTEHV